MTDGQTDRQTDRILIAIPRLHFMQRGNKLVGTNAKYVIKHVSQSVKQSGKFVAIH